jgi:hypothetical protein
VVVTVLSLVIYLILEFTSFPTNGYDSPWYLIQVRSLLETGHFHYETTPLSLYIMSAVAYMIGIENGIRIVVAITGSLSILMIYIFSMKLTKNNRIAAVGAQLFALSSFQYLRLFEDLFKNEVGVFFLLLFVYFYNLELSAQKAVGFKSVLIVTVSFTLVALTHILDVGLALLFGFISLVVFYPRLSSLARKSPLLGFPAASLFLGFVALPNALGHLEKSRGLVLETFSNIGDPSNWSLVREGLPVLSIFLIGITLSLILLRRTKTGNARKYRPYVYTFLFILVFLNIPFLNADFGWRIALMSFIPVTFLLSIFFATLANFSRNGKDYGTKRVAMGAILTMLVFSISSGIGQLYFFQPVITQQQYNDLINMSPYLSNSTLPVFTSDSNILYWLNYIGHVYANSTGDPNGPYLMVTSTNPSNYQGTTIYKGQNLTLIQSNLP